MARGRSWVRNARRAVCSQTGGGRCSTVVVRLGCAVTAASAVDAVLAGLDTLAAVAGGVVPRPAPAPGAVAPGDADGGPGGRAGCGTPASRCTRASVAPGWSASCATATAPTVLLRADMDALPVREATGLPYASDGHRRRRRRQRGAGDARLRPRRARDLPGRRRAAARRRPRALAAAPWSRCSSRPRRSATARGAWSTTGSPSLIPAPDVALAQHVLPVRGRDGRHPRRRRAVGGGQHADHGARPRRARLDAAGGRRPGGARRDDRRPAADGRRRARWRRGRRRC